MYLLRAAAPCPDVSPMILSYSLQVPRVCKRGRQGDPSHAGASVPRAVRPPSAIVMRDAGGGPRWTTTPMSECGALRHRRLSEEVRARIYDVDLDEAAEILRIATGAVVGMAERSSRSNTM